MTTIIKITFEIGVGCTWFNSHTIVKQWSYNSHTIVKQWVYDCVLDLVFQLLNWSNFQP